MNPQSMYEAGPAYSSFYETQYMYQQHQATLPSPPTSPQFSWQVTTIDEDAHTHTYNDKIPSSKARRTQIPAETMSSLMTGPDPVDGKFVCLYGGCMRRFGRKYNIQSHIQTHLADRPFRCNVCAAGFVRRHDLVRHARIHGTSKDFVCGCGKGFSRMDALNRHRQRQICVGGAGKGGASATGSPNKRRSSPSSKSNRLSNKTHSSPESEDRESYTETSSNSASPEPELYNFAQPPLTASSMTSECSNVSGRVHTVSLDAATDLSHYLNQPMYAASKSMPFVYEAAGLSRQHHHNQQRQPQHHHLAQHAQFEHEARDDGAHTPRYIAPVARYPVDASPNGRVLDQEMWVNPSLISPAMTNSSQFHSEGEEGQYYY